jgi:hypothetical protein
MFKSILVLESPWDNERVESTSVWPVVSEFSRVCGIKAYHQVFVDAASFRHWVEVFSADKSLKSKLLYIAAHGGQGRINGLRSRINSTTILESLREASGIKYVHFGSCFFGNDDNLRSLMDEAPHLRWVAGYRRSVDWIESTAMDLMFWRRIAVRDDENEGMRTMKMAESLYRDMNGLVNKLEFNFFCRYGENINKLGERLVG